jgi:serine/threonine-protein kinase haspin
MCFGLHRLGLHVVQGKLAKQYVDAWTIFHNIDPSRSLFPNPNNKSTYPSDQLWAVIEMEDAGDELSDVPVSNFIQAWDIFWGVTLALAKGEEMARFEHRDLHIGNICITKVKPFIGENSASISTLSSQKFGLSGFTTTVIDYTLSRTDANESNVGNGGGQGRVIFTDLDRDKTLFEAVGEYQYDIYRMSVLPPSTVSHPATLWLTFSSIGCVHQFTALFGPTRPMFGEITIR